MNLTQKILIGMGIGLLLGALYQWAALPEDHILITFGLDGVIDAGGQIFITLLKMMVVLEHKIIIQKKEMYQDMVLYYLLTIAYITMCFIPDCLAK